MAKKVLVSGIQSSGRLHLGNYFGAMKQNIERGNSGEFESYVFIADYHSMTSLTNADERRKITFDIACAYLACGLDTENVTLFAQSSAPSHTELSWILATVTPMPMLMLAHSFKDKLAKNVINFSNEDENIELEHIKQVLETGFDVSTQSVNAYIDFISKEFSRYLTKVNAGLFTYPVLMASDILMYNADLVPVGKDQLQHIEMTREIAGKFNRAYDTDFFVMPQAYTVDTVAIVPGIDGEKMSKSKGNVIPLFGADEEIKKAVMSIVTDSARPEDKKDPDTNNIYNIHKLFLSREEDVALRTRYEEGGLGYKEAKELLYGAIISFISPMREKYDYYQSHPEIAQKILEQGGEKARAKAINTMKEVRRVTGLA